MLKTFTASVAIIGVILYFYISVPPKVPVLQDVVWKRDGGSVEDGKIYPFSIKTSPEVSLYLITFKNLLISRSQR